MGPPLVVERRGRVGHLMLNRPDALNALTTEMVAGMTAALEAWRDDDAVGTVLLTGAGERGLCAGGDIVAIYDDARDGGSRSQDFWRAEYRLNALIAGYPKPYVAIQDGVVLGGGIGVSAHGDIRIVTETSQLGMPETAIGFVPDVGGTWLLARAPGQLGTHLALTAGTVGAADAILLGLSDHFVARDRLGTFTAALERAAAADVVARFSSPPPPGTLAEAASWVDRAYGGDTVASILSALVAEGTAAALDARAAILAASPTALAVTLASLRRAARAGDLETVLDQEFRVSLRCLREPDLAEGIRARVIDKDRRPIWMPPAVDEVTDDLVEAFFAPLGEGELGLGKSRARVNHTEQVQDGRMSEHENSDTGSNASGSQSGGSAQTWDSVDSGMSDDVENSLTGQGISDRETTAETARTESDRRARGASESGESGS